MSTVLLVAGLMLGFGAFAALIRIIRGPSVLDRIVAADVLTATLICGLGIEMAVHQHTATLPVLLALALFAVVGSVSVARFLARQEDE